LGSVAAGAVCASEHAQDRDPDAGSRPGHYAPPILAYGYRRSAGSITCSVDSAGVTCADAKTGNAFQVSRDGYRLSPPAA
jgi:hypothetical protein